MTITSVNSATFTSDVIILLRDNLINSIDDPLNRPINERFVMTSYPKNAVRYPIITITDTGSRQEGKLGMGSEGTVLRLGIEIRIWARNIKERDELFDSVYNYLRANQYDASGLIESNLSGFQMTSALNINEDGDEGIKSKVMEVRFLFICDY